MVLSVAITIAATFDWRGANNAPGACSQRTIGNRPDTHPQAPPAEEIPRVYGNARDREATFNRLDRFAACAYVSVRGGVDSGCWAWADHSYRIIFPDLTELRRSRQPEAIR